MPEDITALIEHKILKIRSHGEVTFSDLSKSFQIFKYYYDTENYRKVLVDITKLNTFVKVNEFTCLIPEDLSDLCLAYVHSNDKEILRTFKEIEDYHEFGTYNYFHSEEEAIKWLNQCQTKQI